MSTLFEQSLEAIAFQVNNRLFPSISQAFDRIIAAKALDDIEAIKLELNAITNMTLASTGITMLNAVSTEMVFETPYYVEVEAFSLNALNVLDEPKTKLLRKYDLDNVDIYGTIKGTVDLKNVRVTGFFTEIQNVFKFKVSLFDGHFTGAELAALYLHELGHVFTLYFYMGETLVTNTILAEVVGRIDTESEVEKRFNLARAALKMSGIDPKLTPEVVDGGTITALVLEGQVARMQQRTGSRWYDVRLAEALADQFAARFMAGAPLVSALSKLERSKNLLFSASGFDPVWVGIVSNISTFVMLPFKLAPQGVVLSTTAKAGALLQKVARQFGISLVLGAFSQFSGTNQRYDTHKQRFGAIRRELVTFLKNPNLDAKTRKQALADIQAIDDEVSKIHNFGDVFAKLTTLTWGMLTQRKIQLDKTHTLEELANNRFYELSALFKG